MLDCIECSIPAKELHKYTIQKIVQKKFEVQLMIVVRKKKNSVKFFERDKFIFVFFPKGSKRSRRARTSSQDDRRSSIDVSLSRIRRRPEEFFGGLNAEVTAIEMEDLSSGGRCHFHRVNVQIYIEVFLVLRGSYLKIFIFQIFFRIQALKIQLPVLLVTLHLSREAV